MHAPAKVYSVSTTQRFNFTVPAGERAMMLMSPRYTTPGFVYGWPPPFTGVTPGTPYALTTMNMSRATAAITANQPPSSTTTVFTHQLRNTRCCTRLLTTTPLAQVGGLVTGRRMVTAPGQNPNTANRMVDFWGLVASGTNSDAIAVAELTRGVCIHNRIVMDNALRFSTATTMDATDSSMWAPAVFDAFSSGYEAHPWDLVCIAIEAPSGTGLNIVAEVEFEMELLPEAGTVLESGATMRTDTNVAAYMRRLRPSPRVWERSPAVRAARSTAGYLGSA